MGVLIVRFTVMWYDIEFFPSATRAQSVIELEWKAFKLRFFRFWLFMILNVNINLVSLEPPASCPQPPSNVDVNSAKLSKYSRIL